MSADACVIIDGENSMASILEHALVVDAELITVHHDPASVVFAGEVCQLPRVLDAAWAGIYNSD